MTDRDAGILVLNAGSSSLKFAMYEAVPLSCRWYGEIAGIGGQAATLTVSDGFGAETIRQSLAVADHSAAFGALCDRLTMQSGAPSPAAVGHRVVQGGPNHHRPCRADADLLAALRRVAAFDPGHGPAGIALIEAVTRRFPGIPQIACFDTAFHHDMPKLAQLLPLPRRYQVQGLRRYGFHGLSYEFLRDELARIAGADAMRGRVIFAHLGHGASLAAVRDGRALDTSMGFTPASGLPMGRRSGDIDPGIVDFLARTEQLDARGFNTLVNESSGLLGLSETSADVRELLAIEANDPRAAEALDYFCYQTRKWIGAFAAALGGLDTLVFAGGIGEHAPSIRTRICAGLDFLGIALDEASNARSAPIISAGDARVVVRVMHTDEQHVIARAVARELGWIDDRTAMAESRA